MKVYNLIFGLIAAVALTACGSQTMRESVTLLGGSTASSGTQTGSNGSASDGSASGLHAPSEQQVTLGGNNSADFSKSLTFKTAKTLRIKIKPLPATNLVVPNFTNYVVPYGCVSVSVTVNGMTRGTQVLRVEGVAQGPNSRCASAPTYQILDFTDVTTGTGDTLVEISNANYDNCRYYWQFQYGDQGNGVVCGMSAIWQNHRVALDTMVQVDGDWNLQ